MNRVIAVLRRAWRISAAATWWGLGLWTTLAAFFTVFISTWLASALAAAIAALYLSTRREHFHFSQWFQLPWQAKRRSTAALVVTAIVAIYYFGFVVPDPNQEWATEQAHVPHVEIDGDKIHVSNVRNFTWRSATDYTPGYYDRVYDLNKLDSMYYVVASMPMWEAVAHVFVCFGFCDGQDVAVSVEGRRVKGRPYRLIPSMFRQFQLIYVVGDERDVVGLRGAIWKKPVYFYPVRTTAERKRAIFLRHDGAGPFARGTAGVLPPDLQQLHEQHHVPSAAAGRAARCRTICNCCSPVCPIAWPTTWATSTPTCRSTRRAKRFASTSGCKKRRSTRAFPSGCERRSRNRKPRRKPR